MTTRKAPGAWGRGRCSVLATAFVIALMFVFCLAPAAFAVPKSGDAAPGASGSAPGHTGELPASANAGTNEPGKPAAKPDEKADKKAEEPAATAAATPGSDTPGTAGGGSGVGAGNAGPKSGETGDRVKVWEPNQPVSDKYDGPCTGHEDTYRKGAGHDWHRGVGVGHSGVKPSTEPTESDTVTQTPPPSIDETEGPSDLPTSTPPAQETPTPPVDDTGNEPFLPFTPTQAPTATAAPIAVVAKQSSREAEEYLPYTGGDAAYLLWLAGACALAGGGLRGFDRKRIRTRRRIAR